MFEMLSFRTIVSLLSSTGRNAGTPGAGGTGTGGIGFNIGNYTAGRHRISTAGRASRVLWAAIPGY